MPNYHLKSRLHFRLEQVRAILRHELLRGLCLKERVEWDIEPSYLSHLPNFDLTLPATGLYLWYPARVCPPTAHWPSLSPLSLRLFPLLRLVYESSNEATPREMRVCGRSQTSVFPLWIAHTSVSLASSDSRLALKISKVVMLPAAQAHDFSLVERDHSLSSLPTR